ncbi:MAG: PaaI family thioesterase [Phycisphaerales bacterium]|nr:PaaI family thioesterase [Phycisphaerales bacterium]
MRSRIEASFSRQALMSTLGARLARVGDGEVEIELPWSDGLAQQHGFMHAGAIATIADSACGYACLTRMPEGSAVLSVEFKVNLLSPARGEMFAARGRVVRAGRTISVATADVLARSGGESEKIVALMQATMMRVDPKNGVAG